MLFFALGDTKVPNARYFAFWWNIGFRLINFKIILVYSSYSKLVYDFTTGHMNLRFEIFYYPPAAVPNVLVTWRNERTIHQGQQLAEVVLSEQMFPQYRPTAYRQSLLGEGPLQKLNIRPSFAESAACFGCNIVINA